MSSAQICCFWIPRMWTLWCRKRSFSKFSTANLVLKSDTISPAVENRRSHSADVAGAERYLKAECFRKYRGNYLDAHEVTVFSWPTRGIRPRARFRKVNKIGTTAFLPFSVESFVYNDCTKRPLFVNALIRYRYNAHPWFRREDSFQLVRNVLAKTSFLIPQKRCLLKLSFHRSNFFDES